jgi:hypothetical protein
MPTTAAATAGVEQRVAHVVIPVLVQVAGDREHRDHCDDRREPYSHWHRDQRGTTVTHCRPQPHDTEREADEHRFRGEQERSAERECLPAVAVKHGPLGQLQRQRDHRAQGETDVRPHLHPALDERRVQQQQCSRNRGCDVTPQPARAHRAHRNRRQQQ